MTSFTRRAFLRAGVATGAGIGGVGSLAGCVAPTAPGLPGDDWPRYRFDSARTGYNPGVRGPTGDVAEQWTFQTEDRSVSPPTVADGTVFVNSDSVAALDGEEGASRWTRPVFFRSGSAAAAVAGGTVYAASRFALRALDALDGTQRWQVTYGDRTLDAPAVADGTVYVGSRQAGNRGAVFAFDAADGTRQWRVETGRSGKSIAVADDEVYVASDAVYALSASDGSERWRFDSNRYVLAAPAVTRERVYLAGLLGTVRALDRADGEEAWLVRTPGVVLSARRSSKTVRSSVEATGRCTRSVDPGGSRFSTRRPVGSLLTNWNPAGPLPSNWNPVGPSSCWKTRPN